MEILNTQKIKVDIHTRIVVKLFLLIFLLGLCYLFAKEVLNEGITRKFIASEDFVIPSLGLILFVLLNFAAFLINFSIDEDGLSWVIGYIGKNGKIHGLKAPIKWCYMHVKVYDFFFMPAIAFDASKYPFLFSLFLTNFNDAAWMFYKYAYNRAASDEDKELLKKYAKKSKLSKM